MRKIVLLLPLLAACGGRALMLPAPVETEPPGTDEAKVIVYRDSFRNATKPYAFFDDEELLRVAYAAEKELIELMASIAGLVMIPDWLQAAFDALDKDS